MAHSADPDPDTTRRGLVWDVPVRTVHWLLVVCVAGAWLTRDARLLDLHAACGYCATVLLAFRIVWGFIGPPHARFSHFTYSPRATFAYLRGALRATPSHFTGHNPAGSWAVYALLSLMGVICVSGIIAIAGMFGLGPIPFPVAATAADVAREIHEWLAWALLFVIAAHVAGAIWGGWVHKENLVASMVTGRKVLHERDAAETPRRAGVAFALVGSLAALVAGYLHAAGWGEDYKGARDTARATKAVVSGPWQKECGSCHLAYAPSLLPMRSWDRMFAEQEKHFGEDLSLSHGAIKALNDEAQASAPATWAERKLVDSIPQADAPLRISEAPFWVHVHHDLPASAFKAPVSTGRHDCEACHVDAASGIFHPRMIQKPTHEFTF
jgi:cytochrome b